jgi:cephalosporin hydroxylase
MPTTATDEQAKPTRPGIDRLDLIVAIAISLMIGACAAALWMSREAWIVERFHAYYYDHGNKTWDRNTFWLGTPIEKLSMDLMAYQELLWDTKPDVLLEMGTARGGSAYYFASIFDLMGRGRVITVDIQGEPGRPVHPRITYLLGSSTSPEIVRQVEALVKPGEKVMVVLDSDHHAPHVLRELQIYSRMVTPGQYLVVEDTNINGHPVLPGYGPGPAEATAEFLAGNKNFAVDRSREKFLITFYPGGWLKRVR